MIECVEYTRKMDDGANPKEWKKADLLILGVSRWDGLRGGYIGPGGSKDASSSAAPRHAQAGRVDLEAWVGKAEV